MRLLIASEDYTVHKVLAAARLAGIRLGRPVVVQQQQLAALHPLARGMLLETAEGHVAQHHAILRYIAEAAPAAYLYGRSAFEQAEVDKWLDFSWMEVEVCLQVLASAGSIPEVNVAQAHASLETSLSVVNDYLLSHTYLVGQHITIADIALGCACLVLREVAAAVVNQKKFPHLYRWLMTVATTPEVRDIVGPVPVPAVKKAPGVGTAAAGSAGPAKAPAATQPAVATTTKPKAKDASSKAAAAPASAGPAATAAAAAVPAAPTAVVGAPDSSTFVGVWTRNRIRVKELLRAGRAMVGQQVVVKGWIRTSRVQDKGRLLFVELNDGSSAKSVQLVLEKDKTQGFADVDGCGGVGASLSVTGTVVESPAKGQEIEVQVQNAEVLGPVYGGDNGAVGAKHYPLAKKAHGLEYLREIAHLRPRSKLFSSAIRVRNAMAYATHKFFQDRGFYYIHTPIVTAADCEGAGEQFVVSTMLPEHGTTRDLPATKDGLLDFSKDFFGRRACLTVSGQLNVETHACALSDCYTFGPTFRAEKSHTTRHLSEFWMIEPEVCFADLYDNIDLAEDYLKFCVHYALEHCADDLEYFECGFPGGEAGLRDRLRNVLDNRFVRITYTQGVELLQQAVAEGRAQFQVYPEWGMDLGSEHERFITEQIYKMPVVMTNYPKDIKAFYMRLDEDGRTVRAMDVLVPKIGEIIGGSQREERLDVLERRCREMNLDPASLWWYLDLRRYGSVPHSGFGLGFERLIMFITGLENIRDVIPFPRAPGLCEF